MTEATADEASEAPQAERPLEKTIETDFEDRPVDGRNYQSQTGERRYSKAVEYKRASRETASKKPSSNKSGLERAVADSKVIADESGITEVLSTILAQHWRWPDANSKQESASAESESVYDTYDGVTFLLFHQDPRTGEVYFSLETKSASYRYVEARGKLALHGETGKVGEFNMLEVAARGLKEENPDAYPILLKALRENGRVYDTVKTYVDGVPSETTWIRVEVKDPQEWNNYALAKNIEGPKVIMSLDEIFGTKKRDWAFNHYDILMGFIEKNWDRFNIRPQYSTGTENNFVPFTYADSILPKHSGLSMQLLNSNSNIQYKMQFQTPRGIYHPN